MKKINTNMVLVDFKGKALKLDNGDLTIGVALGNLLSGKTNNPTLAWMLGKKFSTEPTVDLKAEDIVFLKKELEMSDTGSSMVVGQIIEILDSSDQENSK